MTRHMPFSNTAFVLSLSCAIGGCVDVADDEAAGTALAEQAISNREVRLRRITASVLEEGGDEIYLTASQSSGGSVNIIRPPGDPDYWRFDDPGTSREMNQHVGTIVPGSLLIVNLWEQDGGPHDEIGTIDFQLTSSGAPRTFDTPTGHFVAIEDGLFAVRFTNGARYKVWFDVLP